MIIAPIKVDFLATSETITIIKAVIISFVK